MKILILKDEQAVGKEAAKIFKEQLINKPDSILGLATGSTPISTYKELIRMNKEESLDFSKVRTFNLDEYCGISKENEQSYYYFMKDNLFNHVNIDLKNTDIPNGEAANLDKEALEYDLRVQEAGRIDLQILGIGPNAHIGFNEPDDKFRLKTHVATLDKSTIEANARFFNSIDEVPTEAISMGIGTIMSSKKIILIALGKNKAQAVKETINSEIITSKIPSTILKLHPDVTIILDEEAASLLREKN